MVNQPYFSHNPRKTVYIRRHSFHAAITQNYYRLSRAVGPWGAFVRRFHGGIAPGVNLISSECKLETAHKGGEVFRIEEGYCMQIQRYRNSIRET